MTVRGRRTQLLLMMAIQITHKQEKGTEILSLPRARGRLRFNFAKRLSLI